MGTPAYMAPEQALGLKVDFRTDLFALGLLVYELASGVNPFAANTVTATLARIIEEEPPLLSDVRPESVPELDRIVATCLCKEPADRYSSTQEVVADSRAARSRCSPACVRSPCPGSGGLGRRTVRWWWDFHQLITSAIYAVMIYPAWYAQRWLPQPWGMLFLFAVLASAAAATSLRLHLLFLSRHTAEELSCGTRRTRPWLRGCDAGFTAAQLLAAVGIFREHPEFAMLFVVVATATLVSSLAIEPAAVRAAFKTRSTGAQAWRGSSPE